jgi:hypothetical protein
MNSITYYTYTFLFSQAFFARFLTFFQKFKFSHTLHHRAPKSAINFVTHTQVGYNIKNATSPIAKIIPAHETTGAANSTTLVFKSKSATNAKPNTAITTPMPI